VYDAQNRLKSVTYGSTTTTFKYDGLNRKISQTVGGVTTYDVWDGWNLIEERGTGNTLQNAYVYGAGEIVEKITGTTPYFYYQDGSGSTSHLSDAAGNLLESYTYSGFGQPTFYDANGAPRIPNTSAYGVRHLFQGQLWTQQTGLNDHRNRTALPTMGVFLQPDPIGFAGDPSNLYRYCGNNAVNRRDPSGLVEVRKKKDGSEGYTDRIVVEAPYDFEPRDSGFRDVTDRNGGLGFLNQGGNGAGFDWFGGTAFTFQHGGTPTSFHLPPFLPPVNLPPVPPSSSSSPVGSGVMPNSSGFLFTAQADAGLIYGAGANWTGAYGIYNGDDNGGWQSYGGMANWPGGGRNIVDPQPLSQNPFIVGGAVSVAGGAWFSNAVTRQDVMGPFASWSVITPWGSSSYSYAPNGIYVITVSYGYPPGAAITGYPTNTIPFRGH
jgi:RHS repeat-associated protein